MSDVRRNQWGQYLILEPNGTKERGYTRVTTVAKTLDDGGGLIPWKATATVVGASRRPGLSAQWQALISKHNDPWYDTPESKAACKKLVEECATAGGSTDRAELGTALHALTDQLDLGHQMVGLTDQMLADLDAYKTTIEKAGVTFDTDMIEQLVVLDRWQVAGTADRLSARLPDGRHVVADLKTGTSLDYSWQSIAVQLAAYAHADWRYQQLEVGGKRLPMPNLTDTFGLVVHLPAGEARCVLYTVDLVAGWDAFERSMWTRGWRKNRKLSTVYQGAACSTSTSTPTTTTPTSKSTTTTAPSTTTDKPDTNTGSASILLATQMQTWPLIIRERLGHLWPFEIPTPGSVRRGEHQWTDNQLATIRNLCDLIDAPFTENVPPNTGRFTDRNTNQPTPIGA